MLILSLDSAGAGCGAAIWRDGKILAEKSEPMERGQDRRLIPLVLETLKEAKVSFDDFDRIAVTRGPGSFTGLRIGLAAARGIGLAANKPVLGIDRFSIFRAQIAETDKPLLVVINSKRKELYCRFYPAQGAAAEPAMMTVEEIAHFLRDNPGTIVTGDASVSGVIFQKIPVSETVTAAALAASADANDPAFLPRPLYLRAPDVTVKAPALFPITPDQAAALAALHAASFGSAAWSLEQIAGSLALPTTQGWAAFEGGKPIGFLLAQMTPGEAEILTLAVHPALQRRGIGSKLMQKLIQTAQDTKTSRIFLEVAADNHAAGKLYEKLGFRKTGARVNYYRRGDSAIDAVLYERILSEQ